MLFTAFRLTSRTFANYQSARARTCVVIEKPLTNQEILVLTNNRQLHVSIVLNVVEATLWLIEMAPHPCLLDIINDDSHTALHLAVFARQPQIVRKLLLAGANTRLRTRAGNTPLHVASGLGDVVSTRALLKPLSQGERIFMRSKNSDAQQMMGNDLELRNYVGECRLFSILVIFTGVIEFCGVQCCY